MNADEIQFCYHESPIGPLLLSGIEDCLYALSFPVDGEGLPADSMWRENPASFANARRELDAYFEKKLERFTISYLLRGSQFQLSVWRALSSIPYGSFVSYGEIAKRVGKPKGAQAVGMANHANPLPIIIPCHRVIGADGSMVGFGGGIDLKRWLLTHEGITLGQTTSSPGQLGFAF
nr:methylated-DNA--[protein]-cysteine S-methyltransferase [uncultured Cohaesibacter sp.]